MWGWFRNKQEKVSTLFCRYFGNKSITAPILFEIYFYCEVEGKASLFPHWKADVSEEDKQYNIVRKILPTCCNIFFPCVCIRGPDSSVGMDLLGRGCCSSLSILHPVALSVASFQEKRQREKSLSLFFLSGEWLVQSPYILRTCSSLLSLGMHRKHTWVAAFSPEEDWMVLFNRSMQIQLKKKKSGQILCLLTNLINGF